MRRFSYDRAASKASAVPALERGAKILCGGTELLNWMRIGIDTPAELLDINPMQELHGIRVEGNALFIGATTTLGEVGVNEDVKTHAPALSIACMKSASPQIRNRATLGGNILQKTRCLYFRAEASGNQIFPWPCNKRVAGSGCAALDGSELRAALFGATQDCVASLPSDSGVALAALDAEVLLLGPNGERVLPLVDFHLTPKEAESEGLDPMTSENRLETNEIILGYRIPLGAASAGSNYLKVRQRESYEHALISAAVAVEKDGNTINTIRIAVGAVAMKPWRLKAAEAALVGKPLTKETVRTALDAEFASAEPLPGQDYKIKLAVNAVIRAIFEEENSL